MGVTLTEEADPIRAAHWQAVGLGAIKGLLYLLW